MSEHFEEVQKLKDLLGKKFPKLNNEEIEKISNQFMELGYFLVRLQIKKYLKPREPP